MDNKYRKTIIAGNWKMNMLPSDVEPYCASLAPLIPENNKSECVLCVPSVLLHTAKELFLKAGISLGAQNVNENEKGAYTGEVSAAQLSQLGAKYVIIGHSERRMYYGEDNPSVNLKLRAVLDAGMIPILCVGESLAQREHEVTMEFISFEVKAALYGVSKKELRRVVIAYEPIWAIGTGLSASAMDAQAACREIRAVLRRNYGSAAARAVYILYGGSMNEKNAHDLLSQPDVDGGLIGGASLEPKKFAAILKAACELSDTSI